MAFQKTQGRKEYIQPTGMPDLSGYTESAKSFYSLADAASSIGTSMRAKVYNDALLEAEIAGKTAGVKYEINEKTGERTLVPLVNFDYGKATEMFSKNEQEGVLRTYRKAAIAQYSVAAALDADNIANQALINSPNDPNAIRGAAEGYFDSLRDLDPEIFATVAPKATASFMMAENKALAQQQKDAKAKSILDFGTQFNNNAKIIANLIATTGLNDKGSGYMFQELEAEQNEILEHLTTLGVADDKIQGLKDAQINTVALQSSNYHIERKYLADGEVAARAEILAIKKEFDADPTVDAEKLASSMEQHLQDLLNLDTSRKQEETRKSTATKQMVEQRLLLGDDVTIAEILSMDIKEQDKNALLRIRENRENIGINKTASMRKSQQDQWDTEFDILVGEYETGSIDIENQFSKSVEDMYRKNQITSKQYYGFKKTQLNRFYDSMKAQGDVAVANLKIAMANNSIPVRVAEEQINDLRAKGLIGEGKGAIISSREASNMLSKYVGDYKKHNNKMKEIKAINKKISQNLPLSEGEADKIHDFEPYPIVVEDDAGNQIRMEMDIFSENPQIREQSLRAAVGFFVKTKAIHPSMRDAMKNVAWLQNENDFDAAVQFYSKFMNTVMTNDAVHGYYDGINALDMAGINISLMEQARLNGQQHTQDMFKVSQSSANRMVSKVYTSDSDEVQVFKQYFSEALKVNDLTDKLLSWTISRTLPEQTSPHKYEIMLKQLGAKHGGLENAILDDPRLVGLLKSSVDYYVATGKVTPDEIGYKTGIQMAIAHYMGDIGVEEDLDGNLSWKIHPILQEAQSTAGDRPIEITRDMINRDVYTVIQSRSGLTTPEFERFIDNRQFVYEANVVPGKRPTYRVYVESPFGERTILLNNYSYNFETSAQNDAWVQAEKEIQDSALKQLWMALPGMDPVVVRETFESYEEYEDSEEFLAPLIRMYNEMGIGLKNQGFEGWDPKTIDKKDLTPFINSWRLLGIG